MKHFSKFLLSLVTAALIIFMVTACATPTPDVSAVEPVVEEGTTIGETAPDVEKKAAVGAEDDVVVTKEAAPMAAPKIFQIIGTNGLVELAAATYEGGLGFAEVSAIVDYARAGYPTLVIDAGSNNVTGSSVRP